MPLTASSRPTVLESPTNRYCVYLGFGVGVAFLVAFVFFVVFLVVFFEVAFAVFLADV